MRKSNIALLAIAAIASAILLFIWYNQGLDKVDAPLDLILAIIWWVVVALAAWLIMRKEAQRREACRTAYVNASTIWGPCMGERPAGLSLVDALETSLKNLEYDYEAEEAPAGLAGTFSAKVMSKTFDADNLEEGWEGSVLMAGESADQARPFKGRTQLEGILAALPL